MSFNTTTSVSEREVSLRTLDRFSLNPFSFKIMVESYMRNVFPKPFVKMVQLSSNGKDKMDNRAMSKRKVYIEMRSPGKVGLKAVSEGIDKYGLQTGCLSYYQNFRPKPMSFILSGVEIHLRTPGIEEGLHKNPMRNILARK